MTYFNASKSFNASFDPGQVGSYKQALSRNCPPSESPLDETDCGG